jgi:hypothetical protein
MTKKRRRKIDCQFYKTQQKYDLISNVERFIFGRIPPAIVTTAPTISFA